MAPPAFVWDAELFSADGQVNLDEARGWTGALHFELCAHHRPDWTDAHAAWLGRLSHDCLRYQGNSLAELGADDLDDLLFTLAVAQRDRCPAPPEHAVPALRLVYGYGAEVHGSLAARDALSVLDDDLEQSFLEAMRAPVEAEAATPAPESPPPAAPLGRAERRAQGGGGRKRALPRRKPRRKKR